MAPEDLLAADKTDGRRRARAACDACRARKVKCRYEEGEISCQQCRALDVDCTQDRPRKRRGPPSKYLEEEQRRKQQQGRLDEPPDQPWNAPEQLSLSPEERDLEALAPLFIIRQVINDWFELVHPVAPILRRDSFLQQLDDSSKHDQDFIGLAASICAATVTTLRRKASEYALMVTVEKCYRLVHSLDHKWHDSPITLTRCQIKYNMAVALGAENGLDYWISQMQFAEATAMVGRLVHYEMQNFSFCDREMVKRLYWLCFAGQCTQGLHGRPFLMPINSFADIEPLRPLDLTDQELQDVLAYDETWHGNTRSYIPGLNALTNLFMLWYRSQQHDTSSLVHLQKYLDLVLTALDHIPPELRWRGGLSRPPRSNFGTDVQMVNLYITQIHIRSFLLDQMASAAHRSQNTAATSEILASRQNLVNDMLAIVYQMPEDTLEANGNSLISKLRDIGLALLNDSTSETSFMNLDRLLAKLDRLDVRPSISQVDSTSPMTTFTSPGFPT